MSQTTKPFLRTACVATLGLADVLLAQLGDQFVAVHAWHGDVADHQVRRMGDNRLKTFGAGAGLQDVIAFVLKKRDKKVTITPRNIDKYLGVKRFRYGVAEEKNEIGQVTGLAWTQVGGEVLYVEASLIGGKGELIVTGQIGEVMQESARAALTWFRSRWNRFGLQEGYWSAKVLLLWLEGRSVM